MVKLFPALFHRIDNQGRGPNLADFVKSTFKARLHLDAYQFVFSFL